MPDLTHRWDISLKLVPTLGNFQARTSGGVVNFYLFSISVGYNVTVLLKYEFLDEES